MVKTLLETRGNVHDVRVVIQPVRLVLPEETVRNVIERVCSRLNVLLQLVLARVEAILDVPHALLVLHGRPLRWLQEWEGGEVDWNVELLLRDCMWVE